MFRKFFAALSALTANTQALADSMAEANQRFRANLLDGPTEDVPALDHQADEDKPRRNGRKATV